MSRRVIFWEGTPREKWGQLLFDTLPLHCPNMAMVLSVFVLCSQQLLCYIRNFVRREKKMAAFPVFLHQTHVDHSAQ